MTAAPDGMTGRVVLVVEDEYLLAEGLADYLRARGAEVVGPAGTVADALQLLQSTRLHGAILDINLRNERVYPVADLLLHRGVPFVFATGYGGELEQPAYADVPRCIKPFDFAVVAKALLQRMEARAEAR
jgi:DNA-binding response OmpR family regulator